MNLTFVRNFNGVFKISFLEYVYVLRLACLSLLVVTMVFSISVSFAEDKTTVPSWIKKMAGLWSQDQVSDQDFLNGLAYLVENDLLYVEKLEQFKNENQNLKIEKTLLLNEIDKMSQQNGSESNLKITLHTSKLEYGSDDIVVIFGTVNQLVDDQKVSIVISNPKGTFLSIVKVAPKVDGSYAFVASDPKFKEFGEYVVNVYYAGQVYEKTLYTFNPKL